MTDHERPALPTATVAPTITSIEITVATSANERPMNDDAIGINGWQLTADDVNPLDLTVPVSRTRGAVIALTDGLTGAPGSTEAAALAARELTRRVVQGDRTTTALHDAFRDTDALLHRTAESRHPGMGCTAAAVLVRSDGRAFVGNVGDVRLYRLESGYLVQVTHDDRSANDRSVVTRCLGGRLATTVDPHLVAIPPALPDDLLLLCSDGLHNSLSDAEIGRIIASEPAGFAAAHLVRAVKSRPGNRENVTVVLLRLRGTGGVSSAPVEFPPIDRPPAPRPPLAAPGLPPAGPPGPPPVAAPPSEPKRKKWKWGRGHDRSRGGE